MGVPPQSLHDSLNFNGKILRKIRSKNVRRNRRVLMKRSRRGMIIRREGSRTIENVGIEKRVRTLKKLIPSRESQGLDGLFRDTAAYIMSLQMRVRVMQIMVDVLAASQDH